MRRIKKYNKSRILLACSTCMTATLSVPLVAQEAPLKLADVVVTATKTGEQSLQNVPASISVMSEDDLQESGANNIEDLVQQTPGLGINRNGPASRLYMRGIGTNLDFIGSDPSVTVHVDGVYQSRTVTALDDFLGVERVEVLRGPQGTLYGRNSIGGTVNVISKLPQAELERIVRFDVGTDSSKRFSTYVSGALNQDESVLGNISLIKSDHAPYVTNINKPESEGLSNDDSLAGRGTLRYLVGQNGEVILRADYSNTDKAPIAYKSTGKAENGDLAPRGGSINIPSDAHEVDFSFQDPKFKQINKGTSTEVIWQLRSGWSVTSLTAYRDLGFFNVEDTDGSNIEFLFTEVAEEQKQFSEELRFNYKSDRLRLVTGLYFLDEDHESDVSININGGNSSRNFDTSNDTTAYALFGQGTYGLTEKLNATLGLRYSNEEKKFSNAHVNLNLPVSLVDYSIDEKESWNAWSPKAAIDYTFDDGPMLYGSVSRGFKSGGFNLTSEDAEYDPEFVWSYEIGAKEDWLNKSLRANVALFYYDYSDLQVSSFDQPGTLLISNAADANIQGVELELSWMPSYDWMVDFNYAFLDAKYKDYQSPQGIVLVDVSDNDLNSAPTHKFNTAVQYFQELSEGTLSYRVEYFWQDKSYFTAFNEDTSSQGAYGIWNARINFTPLDESWELQLYGENLGDKAYSTSSREFPAAGPGGIGVTKDIGTPRTFGARLTYNFM
jgi:iron complex outermembrane receptor protein